MTTNRKKIYCKNCGDESNNGTDFCKRKCRTDWIKKHNIKGGKKKAARRYDEFLMKIGSTFSNEE